MDNLSFIVDTTKLKDAEDVLGDDCVVWINNGVTKVYIVTMMANLKSLMLKTLIQPTLSFYTLDIT